jgi:hypothetical protein
MNNPVCPQLHLATDKTYTHNKNSSRKANCSAHNGKINFVACSVPPVKSFGEAFVFCVAENKKPNFSMIA